MTRAAGSQRHAEAGEADVFATTDDRLLALAVRSREMRLRVVDPVTLAREVLS